MQYFKNLFLLKNTKTLQLPKLFNLCYAKNKSYDRQTID